MIRPTAAIALLALAACGQQPENAAPKADPVVAPKASAGKSVAYECNGDLNITAIYGTDAKGQPDAAIFIRGTDFQMRTTPAASGTRYATEYGLEAGMGLIWWDKGETALLQQAPEAKVGDPAAGQTIRTCTRKS